MAGAVGHIGPAENPFNINHLAMIIKAYPFLTLVSFSPFWRFFMCPPEQPEQELTGESGPPNIAKLAICPGLVPLRRTNSCSSQVKLEHHKTHHRSTFPPNHGSKVTILNMTKLANFPLGAGVLQLPKTRCVKPCSQKINTL